VERLAKFRARDHLTFPLLSDPDHAVMTAYGVWGEKTMYGKKVTGVIRSTFIINADGTVAEALYNVRAKGHVARVRGLLGLD
jgi:peroxiredoxin Q/BCP